MKARRGCGCLITLWMGLSILGNGYSAWIVLTSPSWDKKLSPYIPLEYVAWYGYYQVAVCLLLICLYCMQKWALYVWTLLALAASYLEIQYVHLPPLEAAALYLSGPLLIYILLQLSGSWVEMESSQ